MNTLYSSLLLRLIHLHIASLSCQTITPHLNDNLQKGNKKNMFVDLNEVLKLLFIVSLFLFEKQIC